VSLKSSDVLTVVEATALYAKQANYPTHIGVTEAGKAPYAVTKSACGLAPILSTHRRHDPHHLLGDPVPEIQAAFRHLASDPAPRPQARVDRLPDLRPLEIDLEGIVAEVEKRLAAARRR